MAVGLLGLARLQARTTIAQIESYQRTQALLLAQDMADRMMANKGNAAAYVGSDYGSGGDDNCPASGTSAVRRDACAWDAALRGAAERSGATAVGTLRGGRGCVEAIDMDRFEIVVAWQGLSPTVAPASDCARDRYGADELRRAVVVPVGLADLSGT